MLIDKTLKEFNEVLGSDAPAPGGGSVAALSGSLGANLAAMVCRLSISRPELVEFKLLLEENLKIAGHLSGALEDHVDRDTEAFNEVMTGFRMPKSTEDEKLARSQAIQEGYKKALQSPLDIAEDCLKVLEVANNILGKTNPNTLSDLGVAALEAHTGLEGAVMNVLINLPSIKDREYASMISTKVEGLLSKGHEFKTSVYSYVMGELTK